MAYFENVAADLDRAQASGTLMTYVEQNAQDVFLPFKLAKMIAKVPHWENVSTIGKTKTTYPAKLSKWLADGIDFDPAANYNCEQAEQFVIESIRLNQHEKFLDPESEDPADPRPAVIFTVDGKAVAYKKSVGRDSSYGLRDSKDHNIGAQLLVQHEFEDTKFETDAGGVITYELEYGQTFTPIRPAVTSFDLAKRRRFIAGAELNALEYAGLTLRHDAVVRRIDDIIKAQKNTSSHLRKLV